MLQLHNSSGMFKLAASYLTNARPLILTLRNFNCCKTAASELHLDHIIMRADIDRIIVRETSGCQAK